MTQQNLPMGRVGGHRGMDVRRVEARGPSLSAIGLSGSTMILKTPLHDLGNQGDLVGVDLFDLNVAALHNEAAMLAEMTGSGYAPELIEMGDDHFLYQEDLGQTEAPQDMELWRRNCVRMLAAIRARGLRHGDIRGNNVITRGDRPWAVDWQEAHRIGDVPPQKSPYSDSNLLMQHIEGTPGPNGQFDTPRVARRWRCALDSLGASTNLTLPLKGKVLLDLGCFQGDFVALAAAEGMLAWGIDSGGFRSGENSIEIGKDLWRGFPFGEIKLMRSDIFHIRHYEADVVIMFSTWPYIVKDHGFTKARNVLAKIINDAEVFFFETQLAGDGPGPHFLRTDDDVAGLLRGAGAKVAKPIATFPVTGRPASRTVWRVEG